MSKRSADDYRKAHSNDPAQLDEETFLGRWSRRKRDARHGVDLPEAREPAAAPELDASGPEVEQRPELTDADMPPLEELTEESDYSGFLSPKVSEQLRKAALRKLFQGASFNIRDGLDDYDEDYSTFEVFGDIVTADSGQQNEVPAEQPAAAEAPVEQEVGRAAPDPDQQSSTTSENEEIGTAELDTTAGTESRSPDAVENPELDEQKGA